MLQSQRFEDAGASVGLTPSDVVGGSDITFSCVSDPQVAKDVKLYYLIFLYADYLNLCYIYICLYRWYLEIVEYSLK